MRVLAAAIVLAASAVASADPSDLVARPLVLEARGVEASLSVEASLARGHLGEPLSLSPDVWVGVTSRVTVGVIHSNASVDRIDAGASFCVHELASQCDRAYHGTGVDVRWSALAGDLALAPRARLLVRDVDPFKPALTVGALARWHRGRYAISTDPYLRLGLANTDRGNRHALVVPLWLAVQPTCRWLVALHTGWDGDLAVIRDGWHVPMALVVRARATSHVDLAVEAGFSSALGPQNNSNQRAAMISASWRR